MMRRPVPRLMLAALLGWLSLAAQAADGPAIWELRGPGSTIRMLGSVHLLRESDYPLPDSIARVAEQAQCMVFELDLDELDALQMASLFERLGRLPDDRTLREVLGPGDYARAAELSRGLGIELDMLAAFKPWFAALTIMNLEMMRLGFHPGLGLDQQLAAVAVAEGKEVLGLETIEFQVGLFDDLPDRTQSRLLLQTLEEAGQIEQQMGTLLSAWRGGRVRELADELGRSFSGYPEIYERFITARNRAWIDRIVELSRGDQDCLVVVGALHLVGQDSVIDMLRERGLDVDRWPGRP